MQRKLFSLLNCSATVIAANTVKCRSNTRNVMLSYKIIGDSATDPDAPPVLILHGLLSNKKNWYGLGKTLLNTTRRSVVTVDLRNHGQSPHSGTHRYDEMAEDVLKLYEKLAITRASLIGHCMGGRLCMYVALTQPKKVAGLLVVDISPLSVPPEFYKYYPGLLQMMKKTKIPVKKIQKARKEVRKELRSVIKDEYLLKLVVTNIINKTEGGVGWACNIDSLTKNFKYISNFPTSKGKQYLGPTLFLGGQLSNHIPPDELPLIRNLFPKAVIKYIPKARHYPHADDPKTFMENTIAFINTND